jgi:hypothetical protein
VLYYLIRYFDQVKILRVSVLLELLFHQERADELEWSINEKSQRLLALMVNEFKAIYVSATRSRSQSRL